MLPVSSLARVVQVVPSVLVWKSQPCGLVSPLAAVQNVTVPEVPVALIAFVVVIVLFAIALLGLIRPLRQDIKAHGGLAILKGNLAIDGCVIKTTGITNKVRRGPARVFDREEDAMAAVTSGKIKAGDVRTQFDVDMCDPFILCGDVLADKETGLWVLRLAAAKEQTIKGKQQLVEVGEGSKQRVYIFIVRDVVTGIFLWRPKER